VKLGTALEPTNVSWEDLKVDTAATLASYILQHRIGLKLSDPEG